MTSSALKNSETNPTIGVLSPLKVTRISPAIGAIVEGIDISKPLGPARTKEIHELLLEHQVIFFRKQRISPEQQRDFAAHFGKLHIHPLFPTVKNVPEAIVLDTKKNDLADNALWHVDVSFQKEPPLGAVLTSRLLPENGGGDTLWASSSAAYDALPESFKKYLDGLTAEHDFVRSFPAIRFARTEEERKKLTEVTNKYPPVTHPVIRVHPETGKKGIFVSEGFTTKINDVDEDQSKAILDYLFKHSIKPEFSLRWRWEEGDVAFWDNRITIHYATNDYLPSRRIMNRVTIVGDEPYGPHHH